MRLNRVVLCAVMGGLTVAAPLSAMPPQAPVVGMLVANPVAHAYAVRVAAGEVLHVEATGTGAPVVIIPGLFGSAFGFRKIVEPIAAAGHRVVVIEPLGVGASGRPKQADYSLEAQARRVAAVMDSMHLSGATVVGHSVGNSVALRLALARPGLVHDIVSIEGGIAETAGTAGLRQALSMASWLGHFGGQGLVKSKLRGKFRDSSGDPSWVTDAVMAGYLQPITADYEDVIAAYKAMVSAPEEQPLAARLPHLRVPVLLLLGAAPHDGGPGDNEVSRMKEGIAGLRVALVPGSGHWIQEERPQAVIDAVVRSAR